MDMTSAPDLTRFTAVDFTQHLLFLCVLRDLCGEKALKAFHH